MSHLSDTMQNSASGGKLQQPQAARESPLLNLPAELRNQIYDYVFEELDFCIGITCKTWDRAPYPKSFMRQLSLGSVCRQLHKETSLLPIASARFLALAPADVLKFGHRMPLPQRRAVQQLKIRLVENQDMEDFWQCDTEAWYGLDWSGISPERVMRGMRTAFPGLRELTLEVHNVFLYGMPPDLDGYKPPKWMVEGKVMCGQPRILIEGYACDYACFGPANYAGHR